MSQKTKYRVIGKKICLHLSSERGSKAYTAKTFLKGEEFEASPLDIPRGFLDLVQNLGPAVPSVIQEVKEERSPLEVKKKLHQKIEEEFVRKHSSSQK